MIGILYYLIYIFCGIFIAYMLFKDYKVYTLLSIGLGFGIVLGAWFPAIFALILGSFNILAQILAIILLFSLVALCYIFTKRKENLNIKKYLSNIDKKDYLYPLILIVPFMILIFIIFDGHIIKEVNGSFYGGQSTYGDLAMHLSMITSIARQDVFPPDYSILSGTKLAYPFLVNSQSSSLYMLGTSLRTSVILPSMIMSLSAFLGFYALALEFVKEHRRAMLAFCIFFITGGIGFIFFLSDQAMFKEIFTGYYKTPTNFPDLNLRWVNVICDMMIPQRTLLMGWSVVLPIIVLLKKSIDGDNKFRVLIAGLMASALPMLHTHSFLALGILCAGLLIIGYIYNVGTIKNWTKNWLIFVIPVALFGVPQLFYWVFTQSEGFLEVQLDWVNNGSDSWVWFWIKNLGLVFVMIVPAFIWGRKKYTLWYISATLIYVLAEIIKFQPNPYDNNKLMLIWYIFTCILVADYLFAIWDKLKGFSGRYYFAVITVILLFTSGTLTISREIISNKQYLQYNNHEIMAAKAIDENTFVDALFVTGDQHLNAVAALSGRDILAGSAIYLYYHGLDYNSRYEQMNTIFTDADNSNAVIVEVGADYVYLSHQERAKYPADNMFNEYPMVYVNDEIIIYAVSQRAIDIGEFT